MPHIDARITTGLAGKPEWALHARLAAVWWTAAAGGPLSRYLDALEAANPTEARIAAAETVTELEAVLRLISEITVPMRDDCLAAVGSIALAVREGCYPPTEAFSTVIEFFDFARA